MVLCVLMIFPVGTKNISLNDIAIFQTSKIHFQREMAILAFSLSPSFQIGKILLWQIGLHHPSSMSARNILACKNTQGCMF